MSSTRIYVLVNKDLKMSKGKTAAQVAHAVSRVDGVADTVVVLEAGTESLRNLSQYLWDRDVTNHLYIDEGVNEVPPFSITALAVEPIDDDDNEKRAWFQDFDLLGGPKLWLS